MNTLYSLTYRNLKLNKKRTIVTMIGIILSVALICAVAGMVTSFQRSLYIEAINDSGNYHTILKNVPIDEAKILSQHREIKETFSFGSLGYAIISSNKSDIINESIPYIRVVGFDSNTEKNFPLPLTEGRLPENSNEIVLSADLVIAYGEKLGNKSLKVGDTISLEIGTRVDKDGNVLDNNDILIEDDYTECYNEEECIYYESSSYQEEKLENIKTKEYTIVGILDFGMSYDWSNYNAPAYDVYTILDLEEVENVDLYIQYKHPKNYKEMREELNPKILNEEGIEVRKYEQETNDYLLDVMGVGFSTNTSTALYTVMAIVIGIIMVSSVFVIKNGFSISIVERYKQFGMLSSVGATSKQIKRSVLFEGFLLGIIAIPIGILCGLLAVLILVHLVNYILKDFVEHDMIIFYISSLPIVVAALTSIVTIFLSCYLPARKASKLSIIDLIRSNNSIKMKSRKLKTPKYITKLFGVGGEIAHKNLKRNKKKYRTTVVSLVVSIVIFISLNAFMNMVFNTSTFYFNMGDCDLAIYYYIPAENMSTEDINKKMDEQVNKFLSLGDSGEYVILKSMLLYTTDKNLWSEEYIAVNGYEGIANEDFNIPIQVQSLGKEEYERFVKKVGGKVEDYQEGAILIDDGLLYSQDDEKYHEIHMLENVKENDILRLDSISITEKNNPSSKNEKIEIKVLKRTNEKFLGMPNHLEVYGFPRLIVSDEYLKELSKNDPINSVNILMKTDDVDNIAKQLEKLEEDDSYIHYSNIHDEIRQQRALVLIVSIFLYGFIVVITLIGVTNIFNTITTNMALRSREFAMLKAIGMTKKEFNRMIRLESILYGLKSLVIGIPIGIILTFMMNKALSNAIETPYVLPLNAILISIVFVFIIVYMTMHYSLRKINKQNIIETIREENI